MPAATPNADAFGHNVPNSVLHIYSVCVFFSVVLLPLSLSLSLSVPLSLAYVLSDLFFKICAMLLDSWM